MDAAQVLARCSTLGVQVEVAGDRLRLSPSSQVPPDLLEQVKTYKPEIIVYLSFSCPNPLTPHSTHEHPWEHDPNSCTCFRLFGKVFWCQGVPCRWAWSSQPNTEVLRTEALFGGDSYSLGHSNQCDDES